MNSAQSAERSRQAGLFSTQADRLLELLEGSHGEWVPLPAILRLGIAQYNTRILELRRNGYDIENKTEYAGSVKHSWFKLNGKKAGA